MAMNAFFGSSSSEIYIYIDNNFFLSWLHTNKNYQIWRLSPCFYGAI